MDTCYYSNIPECIWNIWLWRTVPILQLIFGSLGNILNIIILTRRRLRSYSTTVYLICLAGADIGALWSSILSNAALHGFGHNLWLVSTFSCKVLYWINHAMAVFSVWLLVLLTIERMMLTRCPVFSRSTLTRRTSLITSLICFILIASVCAHYPFGYELKIRTVDFDNHTQFVTNCAPVSVAFETFYNKTWPVIILIGFNLIPMMLIVVSNAVIIVTIVAQRKRLVTVHPTGQLTQYRSYRKLKSSSKMVCLISAFFILTTLPYTINRAVRSTRSPVNDKEQAKRFLLDTCMSLLLYCNFTFNFLLYFVSGTIFYQEFQTLLLEIRQRFVELLPNGRGNTATRLPTIHPAEGTYEI